MIQRVGDEDVAVTIERQPDRIVQLRVDGRATVLREGEPCDTWPATPGTGNRGDRAVRDASHPVARVGDEDAARRVDRDAGGTSELGEGRRTAIAQIARDATPGDQADRRLHGRRRRRVAARPPTAAAFICARTSSDPLESCGADPRSRQDAQIAIAHPGSDRCHRAAISARWTRSACSPSYPGPRAAPAPADRRERRDRPRRHHPAAVTGAVEVRLGRGVAALAAADVGVLPRVDVDRKPVGMHRPRTRAACHRCRATGRLPAVEGAGDVVVARTAAGRAVDVREAAGDGSGNAARRACGRRARVDRPPGVDDELTGMRAPVEAPVRDREQPQVRQPDRAAGTPEALGLQLGRTGWGSGSLEA